ncbi:flagellar hook-length control protein FliK [Virgibacillus ndiopensis]|uniref:flagellar hook-length control protein FliK n=1 Tax=Virgibacillus ndiopensis TaxID=2004408 RepID=UPI000C0834EB|nr:flagellar hook-length control protein FliK [Virgibacillus ndiopensis]
MSAIAMMSQLVKQPVNNMQSSNKQLVNDDPSIFQGLLLGEQQSSLARDIKDIPTNAEELLTLLKNSPEIAEKLVDMLKGSAELEKLFNGANAVDEVIRKLEEHLSNLSDEEESSLFQMNTAPLLDSVLKSVPVDNTAIQKQFTELFKNVEKAISQLSNQQNVPKAAASLLKLLEQWTTLEKSSGKNAMNVLEFPKNTEQAKVQAVWRELVQSFQKRNQLVSNRQYNTNAKVTSTDVTKWVQNALHNQIQLDKPTGQQAVSVSTMPMSQLEQYIIYANQSQSSKPVDQQIMEQFQKVVKTSKFLSANNGTSQLSIALRPENLGEMMVKLTQVNGEMTVKIMVTSHAAKEMLESNMHQLKNMFSPHQVVIEKQDISSQGAQNFQGKQQEDAWNESDHGGQSHHSNEDNQNEQSNDDVETQFHELLMNEKV